MTAPVTGSHDLPRIAEIGLEAMPGTGRRVVIVPCVPALLPEYASVSDPVADLRTACVAAVAWLDSDVRVIADDALGERVAESLLGKASTPGATDLLVVANGSARRSEKAPGHLDERAAAYDQQMGELLARGDVAGLSGLDPALGRELLVAGAGVWSTLVSEGIDVQSVTTDHAEDPFGVMYWVVRWQCAS
ncbi:hypothetical protein [Nocardioides gilvus]|uniref:hypothetical protein n=1 Tax=Nocardioides gilvus TaxID=1735589 RepID=UPI001EF6017E|nr:hypothetical protein [Nocardioides gilvus]